MRLGLQFSLLLLVALAWGSGTKEVEGKLELAPEGGEAWVLRAGPDAIPLSLTKKTRFWAHRAAADAKAFKVGDAVVVRIATSESPAELREMADKESWAWLEGIRKGVRDGTLKGFDGKYLTAQFADGTEIGYRATEKTKIVLEGKPATLGDLKTGQHLWFKGRTLPTLDVWLVQISDHALLEVPKKGTSKKSATGPKAAKLPATGGLSGEIALHYQGQSMFDLDVDGRRLHVSYFAATQFTYGGAKCGPSELVHGRKATVRYARDQYGRINASRVDIG